MFAIELEHVNKSFKTLRAVEDVSFNVPSGCIFGFLGPNGAGKTTTIRMIMNIITPDSGDIRVMGQRSTDNAKESIGYMPEERGLYRKMTVRGALEFLGAVKGMNRRALAEAIPRWLEKVNLSEKANMKVEELSKGMQQNLQFVATVINNPPVLILDEPFSGLDPVNTEIMKNIFLDYKKEGGTIIFSTHMMEKAEQICDFILLINKGKKIIEGTLDEVRAGYSSEKYPMDVEGDGAFFAQLPLIKSAQPAGRAWEVELHDGADSQDLLRAVVEKTRIRSFEEKVLSLHEIFIRLVGDDHE